MSRPTASPQVGWVGPGSCPCWALQGTGSAHSSSLMALLSLRADWRRGQSRLGEFQTPGRGRGGAHQWGGTEQFQKGGRFPGERILQDPPAGGPQVGWAGTHCTSYSSRHPAPRLVAGSVNLPGGSLGLSPTPVFPLFLPIMWHLRRKLGEDISDIAALFKTPGFPSEYFLGRVSPHCTSYISELAEKWPWSQVWSELYEVLSHCGTRERCWLGALSDIPVVSPTPQRSSKQAHFSFCLFFWLW